MGDATSIFEQYAQDPDVTRYLIWRPHKRIEETRDFLRRCISFWKSGVAFPWVLIQKKDNRLVGMVEIRVDGHRVELGYVLARPYWGNGYMAEAVRAIIDWVLSRDELYRVWAVCDVENRASARVLEKVGMQREGLLRRWGIHPCRGDEPRDCYCYAITK